MSDRRAPDPARRLDDALARTRWRVEPGRYALLGFADPPAAVDLALLGDEGPGQIVREGGETTLLVAMARLPAAVAAHPQARVETDLAWIRFDLPMSWELVGFLACVTGQLAAHGVPLGAVCGYSRDHVFVRAAFLDAARAALRPIIGEADGD